MLSSQVQKQEAGRIWPMGHSLLTHALRYEQSSKGAGYNLLCVSCASWHLLPEPKGTLTQQWLGQDLLAKQRTSGSLIQ